MSETKHTPTPYMVRRRFDKRQSLEIRTEKIIPGAVIGALIAKTSEINPDEDAAYIVRAVNSHDELVAALKEARQFIEDLGWNGMTVDKINAALAKAEGK